MANYTTTTNLNTSLALKADQLTTYTKTEVDDAIAAIPITDLTDYYNKTETDTLLDLKANSSETYTITQTNDLLQDKMNVTSSLASIQAAIPIESNL